MTNILCKYLIYIHIYILIYILYIYIHIYIYIYIYYFLLVWSQKVSLRLVKILFQTGNINILVFRSVFLADMTILWLMITSLLDSIVIFEEKNYWKLLIIYLSSISNYVIIKDPFTKSLSDEQIKRNINKALNGKLKSLIRHQKQKIIRNLRASSSEKFLKIIL